MMDISRRDLQKQHCLVAVHDIFWLNVDDNDIRRHVRHGKLHLSL